MGSLFLDSAVDAYRAESERTVALAEARLKWIEGNVANEKAIAGHLTNVLREASISDYRLSINTMRRRVDEKQREARRIEHAVGDFALYAKGDAASGLERQRIWPAYRVLQPHIPFYVYTDWFHQPLESILDLNESFIGRSVGGQIHPLPVTALSSVGAVIEYQNRNYQYVVARTGGVAYMVTMDAFGDLTKQWELISKGYRDDLAAIRAGHYDLWKPGDYIPSRT